MNHTKINDTIAILCEKYRDNTFMSVKTESFICNQLPVILQNIEKTHDQQVQRINDMNAEQDIFIQGFLASNRYFYASTTENFFYYNGINYSNVTEDEIIHNILSSISRDRSLMSWKYKTKSAIIKRIKENTIFSCIPESATIQNVLNELYPTIFATKTEAKYFLTILGDNILKKNGDEPLIHLMNPVSKIFINGLNAVCQMWFGVNLNQTFKYKYHTEHLYSQMRILNSASTNIDTFGIGGRKMMNLLCVACHYSNRYRSSDNYLIKYCNDTVLIDSVFFLKTHTHESLTAMFVEEYIVVSSSNSASSSGNLVQISWRDMFYLWKHFLESKKLPNIMSQVKLRNILTVMLEQNYSVSDDSFMGISSKQLPMVNKFLQFWQETMVYDELEPEIEIGELATLFKQHTNTSVSDDQIVNILTHFFPDLEIDQGKYIYRMRCNIWDKQVDIMMAMDDLRDKKGNDAYATVSVYDAYVHYCNYLNGTGNSSRRPSNGSLNTPMLVSKQYFEKYRETH